MTERPAATRGQPLVTIGMPVLNGAKSIGTALQSLRAQTYQNLQIIVCDNASDDATASIVQTIANRDDRVIYRSFATRGGIQTSYARALDAARGHYFMFAPCDDSWDPAFIEKAVQSLEATPTAAACCGRIDMIDDTGNVTISAGVQTITGTADQRWRQALLGTADASRLYGLLRVSMLGGIIPEAAPEGWDHYTAAKIALRGDVITIETLAMRRHQTANTDYRAHILKQEPRFWGQVFYLRHIRRMIIDDPAFNTHSLGARLILWAYVLQYGRLALVDHPRLYRRLWKFGRLLGRFGQKVPF